ncbi:MAG: preprotein translocase subunit SecE [Candidatus Eisenbacteria bacterium]|uniref:Protein translocase subunit SecE n=1 Tax=Eiseniibacteriota bacterium TaxID=2212470 RepID=A0A538TXD7_UNCEI|nr:MAG: preprotein translocase subunit SecE [Candidatus Eisenbacteria bacterium]
MAWTEQLREFVKDVRVEITKVSWPSRTELRDSTVVVIASVFMVAAFVFVVDRVLSFGIGLLFR